MHKQLVFCLAAVVLLAACGGAPDGQGADEIATIVAATLEAAQGAAPAAQEAAAPATGPGSIAGTITYPSEAIPAMTVVAYDVNSDSWYSVDTDFGQSTFQIDNLPAGAYHVVAYVAAQNIGGGYTAAVACGLTAECTDHSLVAVQVSPGAIANAQPHDWYAPEGAFPPNPAMPDEGGDQGGMGSIAGSLGFPSSFIPPMNIVAFDVNSSAWFYITTQQNQTSYQFDNLPAGTYYVVAYPQDDPTYGGGYSAAVPCGLSVECTDHGLLPVTVVGGQITQGVDPTDFYAPPGTFPTSPVQ